MGTSLWLQANGLQAIEGLENQEKLVVIYLHENLISKIENIDHLVNLRVLNLEQNQISKIEGLKSLRQLETLNLGKNRLTDAESIAELREMSEKLTTLDLQNNQFKPDNAAQADEVIQILMSVKDLRVVNFMGNQLIRKVRNYRKTMTVKLKALTYLDDRPVFPRDRACCEAWATGGPDAEKEERQRWINKDRKKIQDSVDHLLKIRENAERRRQELGLPPIGGDVDVETASEAGADLSSLASDVESEKSAASAAQSEGSSHVSMMQQENGKPVSKNIFADDNAMGLEDLDSCTSDAHTTNGTSTRNQTDISSCGGTRDMFSEVDSDVHSEKSFSLDNLPSCNDDVSSIASSRNEGRRILIQSDDEDDCSQIESINTENEQNGLPSLIQDISVSEDKPKQPKRLIEELD